MAKINWKLIAFVGALWWFIYSAPTEESLIAIFAGHSGTATAGRANDF